MAIVTQLSQTYLFKIHVLKNMMDRMFDQVLRTYAAMTLSQFMLLLAVSEHPHINQRAVSRFLGISPAAINRQVEIAVRGGLLHLRDNSKGRGQALALTEKGRRTIEQGLAVLERHLFHIFKDENRQANLMEHLDLLLSYTQGVAPEQKRPTMDNEE